MCFMSTYWRVRGIRGRAYVCLKLYIMHERMVVCVYLNVENEYGRVESKK